MHDLVPRTAWCPRPPGVVPPRSLPELVAWLQVRPWVDCRGSQAHWRGRFVRVAAGGFWFVCTRNREHFLSRTWRFPHDDGRVPVMRGGV